MYRQLKSSQQLINFIIFYVVIRNWKCRFLYFRMDLYQAIKKQSAVNKFNKGPRAKSIEELPIFSMLKLGHVKVIKTISNQFNQ